MPQRPFPPDPGGTPHSEQKRLLAGAPIRAEIPAYTLPDPLRAVDGRTIATADEWRRFRRPEVLELFRRHVYGRVPPTPYQQRFELLHEDAQALAGLATFRKLQVTIASGGG